MVRSSAAAADPGGVTDLPEPSWRFLLAHGLPTFALEGFVPAVVFYGVWQSAGLAAGIAASAAVAGVIVLWQLRCGRDVALAAATGVFITIQALVALAADSATVYLAQPVLVSACWGVAYLASAAIGRPLIGAFAGAWYPFPSDFRASEHYRREFGMQSLVWGVYCLGASAIRLGILLTSGVGALVVVSFLVGTPGPMALVLWGVWHARRAFSSPHTQRESSSAPARS
jgi:Protein of unknown function (DUF3159)